MSYGAWIEKDKKTEIEEARFKFDELAKVYGPFKFYVSNTNGDVIIHPELIHQESPPSGKYIEARWPLSLVGGVREFEFVAITLDGHNEEHELQEGVMPFPNKELGVK